MPGRILGKNAGGDKPVEFLLGLPEANPFLGKRGMRLLLANPDLLKAEQGLGGGGDLMMRESAPYATATAGMAMC